MNLSLQLRRHATAAWQHRWKAMLLTWFICIAGWIAVYLMPNQYMSTARMYADADAILGTLLRGIAVEGTPASQVDVLQRTLLSRPNLERVVARTDLDMRITSQQSRERLIEDLGRQIRITPQTRNLFSIEYRDHDPRVARDVVQTLLTLFVEAATGTDRRQLETARNFVAQQISAYEAQLREAERRRAEFRARYGDPVPGARRAAWSRACGAHASPRARIPIAHRGTASADRSRRHRSAAPPRCARPRAGDACRGPARRRCCTDAGSRSAAAAG